MRTWTVFGGAALTLVLALGQASLQMLWMRGGMPLQARFIAASPVSDSVVVGGDSWGVWVYRLSTGLLERFVPTLSSPRAMVFSPSGEYLATADGVWRLADWSLVSQRHFPTAAVAFSPDSQYIAFGRLDPVIQIYRLHDDVLIRELQGGAQVVFVGYTPDGEQLVSLDSNREVRLWRLADGAIIRRFTLNFQADRLHAALSPDGERLAVGGFRDNRVRVVRVSDGAIVAELPADARQRLVAFSLDGALLATCEDRVGGRVRIWRTQDWSLLYAPFYPFERSERSALTLAFSRDGRTLLAGADEIALWDVPRGVRVGSLEAHRNEIAPLQFSPDSGALYTSTLERGRIYAWNALTGAPIALLITDPFEVDAFCVHPARAFVATARSSATRVWRLSDSSLWLYLPGQNPRFTPDGSRLYTFHSDVGALSWRFRSEGIAFERAIELPNFVASALSPDGQFVALLGRERSAIWRADTGALARSLTPVPWGDATAFFSAQGRYFSYIHSSMSSFVYWSLPEGQQYTIPLGADTLRVRAGAFSPDEQFAAVVDSENQLRLFRLSDGSELTRFAPLPLGCYRLLFSDDERFLALGLDWGVVGVARSPFYPDTDGDMQVDDSDLLRVLFQMGATGERLPEDVNYDGVVDDADLLIVLFYFGR